MKTFKRFDLPVKHLEGAGEDYSPPKARDPHEIARRQMLAKGVLLAEYQAKGIKIASGILKYMIDKEDTRFATQTIAAASLNTAWYNIAQGSQDVMRRNLQLPTLDDISNEDPEGNLLSIAINEMSEAQVFAMQLERDGHERRRLYVEHKRPLGVKLGSTALVLACVPHGRLIANLQDPAIRQMVARDSASDILELSRNLYKDVGSKPTLAQLADNDSPLSVYWRRQATDEAFQALEQATEL